ncbi:MAG: amidophosphoribosyltransferase [Pycnora praestabilis]|nr:MAG: amidophosphoribosyltransferase [Pycnora praestabilis]
MQGSWLFLKVPQKGADITLASLILVQGNGMAAKVFADGEKIKDLPGSMGLGHLRYPTAGTSSTTEAQPMFVNSPHGLALTHNGNLVNAPELKRFLDQEAHRHINTDSDSEVMLNVFANELNDTGKARVNADDCFAAVSRTYDRCRGAWACIAMIAGFGLIAFRDRHGIRPLLLGSRVVAGQRDWMIASESVALQFFGCHSDDIVDLAPGEGVIISKGSAPDFRQIVPKLECTSKLDIFEHVYLSRPDSTIDGISVYASRRNMGLKLAKRIEEQLGPDAISEIDCVIPIPETANAASRTLAQTLGKELVDGFVKNRYIFRTFIMPNQKLRRAGVRRKLNAIESEFKGRNVLLVDDSIVRSETLKLQLKLKRLADQQIIRGTTSKEIVQMAREAGARKVIFASCSPPITQSELIAHHRSQSEIATEIGADEVIYQTLEDLEAAVSELSSKKRSFEVGVFTGKYTTLLDDGYLEHLDQIRGERKKKLKKKAADSTLNGDDLEKIVDAKLENKASNGHLATAERQQDAVEATTEAGETQDISLHNLNDHDR